VRILLLTALAIVLDSARGDAQTQTPVDRTDAVRVFLDCGSCDDNYVRTEVTFINYVRDREAADVHVLVTTEETGGGGLKYTLKFIGLERFTGVEQTLTYSSPQTATEDERRRGFTRVFKLGLVRYVSETPLASQLTLEFKEQDAADVRDPWNFWVFRVGVSANLQGEETQSERSFDGFLSANRTTANWKVNVDVETDYNREKFTLEEGETFTAIRKEYETTAMVVKSLSNHWSAGIVGALGSSTFSNYDLRTRLGPGVEFDFFPYDESTRILAVLYTVGVETSDYQEETIFGKTFESLFNHRAQVSLGLRQPWGSSSASFVLSHYLNEGDKYRISVNGNLDVRLFKGFSVEVFGEASRLRDQLSLRRGDATNEEILVRQRELASGYEYEFGFGISYSFGSIYNNVVNPRFRNTSGF
jgi:hypothetical protein